MCLCIKNYKLHLEASTQEFEKKKFVDINGKYLKSNDSAFS